MSTILTRALTTNKKLTLTKKFDNNKRLSTKTTFKKIFHKSNA